MDIYISCSLTALLLLVDRKPIKPGEEVVHEVSLFASRSGEKELMVDFSCSELAGIEGSATVYIPYTE